MQHRSKALSTKTDALSPKPLDAEASLRPMTGAQALAYWDAQGCLGVFSNRELYPEDSPELAHRLRREAETRDWSEE